MSYCHYYQAQVPNPKNHIFLVGSLKYFDNMCFDRTLDKENNLFEFFVPDSQKEQFLRIMKRLEKKGIVKDLTNLPNRFM